MSETGIDGIDACHWPGTPGGRRCSPPRRVLDASGPRPSASPRSSGLSDGVWRGGEIVGLLDFDHARPAPPLSDRRRIDVFCEAYGVVVLNVVDRVAEQQRFVLERCEALGRQGIEPQATWIRDGYLETVRDRIRWTESLRL
jgi:hypothetical protein